MRLRAIVILGLAIALGAMAVFLTRTWLASQLALRGSQIAASLPAPEVTTVVVAAKPLRFGTKIDASSIKVVQWPASAVPLGAFKAVAELIAPQAEVPADAFKTAGELTGPQPRFVLQPIEVNEPVLASKITGPGGRGTLSAIIEEGKKAITLRVNDVLGVAGYVLPGDRVDIMLTRDFAKGDAKSAGLSTDVLMQNVKVLGIDQLADQKAEQPIVAKAVTFEVSTDEAQKLTLASQIGSLSLALRGVQTLDDAKVRRIAVDDLDIGPLDVPPPPPPPAAIVPAPVRPGRGGPVATIGVTRGLDRVVYPLLPGGRIDMLTPIQPAPPPAPEAPAAPEPAQTGPAPANAAPPASSAKTTPAAPS